VTAGGRWRIQLGAFSSEANARRAWGAAAGRLPGLQPSYVRAGNVVRVQAGPLRDRAAAARACAAVGNGCFPVGP
jgi:cell division septation protein DedD